MHDWLRARTRATPHKLALLFEGQSWNYAELDRLTDQIAAGLLARGVEPGDNVATLLPNRADSVALVHALARVGAVLVPLNTRLTDTELADQIELTAPRLVIADDRRPTTDDRQWTTVDAICTTHHPLPTPPPITQSPSHPAAQAIVFTSGTTGRPQGVVLTFANHFWSATASAYRLGLSPDDRWLSCLPLYHVGGLAVVFRSCLYGTAMVLQRRFDVDAFNRSLDEDRITLTSLVPTMLHRLLAARTQPWPKSLRLVLLGGAAATPELLAASREAGVPVATTYGLTEAASQVATACPQAVRCKPGSVGRPLMFTEVRVTDETGNDLPPGAIGAVLVRGPTVMQGYYRDPEATARALRDGWLHTGDVGYLDAEGDLWIVQRRRDIIVSGGENVYPAEVEAVLRQHPGVADVCVVGVPDAEWGQRVAAAVQLRPGVSLRAEELLAFSRERLAGYKQPRVIRFVERWPQTASGKIRRDSVEAMMG